MKGVVIFVLSLLLVSCSDVLVKQDTLFQLNTESALYQQQSWYFSGRLALSNKTNSMIVSINWQHSLQQDKIELAGPFGIGRTVLLVRGNIVIVEKEGKQLEYYGDVDHLVSTQLGIDIPLNALKYWVLGLPHPEIPYYLTKNGFGQSHWQVNYQKMQSVDSYSLPRKIQIKKQDNQLKLIINHWDINS